MLTIWEVTDGETDKSRYAQVTTTRRDRRKEEMVGDGKKAYTNSNWGGFVRGIKDAIPVLEKVREMLKDEGIKKVVIHVPIGGLSFTQEMYMKNGEKIYPASPTITLRNCEIATDEHWKDMRPATEDAPSPEQAEALPFD